MADKFTEKEFFRLYGKGHHSHKVVDGIIICPWCIKEPARHVIGQGIVKCEVCAPPSKVKHKTDIHIKRQEIAGYFNIKGQSVPVDTKGNIVDKKDDYYSNNRDYRGWMEAANKDTSGYERGIRVK